MTGNTTEDGLQALVRQFAEAVYADPGEKPVPMATTSADEVVRSMLTESTGRHFLDSGGAYGRHWQENQENPPWENAEWDVDDGFVTHNVYDYLTRAFDRDETCMAVEFAYYAARDAVDIGTKGFVEELLDGSLPAAELRDWGVPENITQEVLGFQNEVSGGRDPQFSFNTYNGECHGLSQCVKGVAFGGPYAKYGFLSVHQGADVRGGYTHPRVFKTDWGGWLPGELEFRCDNCEWVGYESCLYGEESLEYFRTVDGFKMEDAGLIEEGEECPALEAAHDHDEIDGGVFHRCKDGGCGHVTFM